MYRTPAQIEWKKKEAAWKKSCSETHKLFCNCSNWFLHLAKQKKWCTKPIGHEFKKGGTPIPTEEMAITGGGGNLDGDRGDITFDDDEGPLW